MAVLNYSYILLGSVLLFTAFAIRENEEPCWSTYKGVCMNESGCRNPSGALSGKCPSQPSGVKCCPPYQETPCTTAPGTCQRSDLACSGGSYRRGLCPTQNSRILCCVKSSGSTASCGTSAKELACDIKNLGDYLLTRQVGGVNDGADARSNIVDTCNGRKAKRSSYGTAPGGYTCLKSSMLRALKEIATKYNVQVNALGGASHSSTSKHYCGAAFDLQKKAGWENWVRICVKHGSTWQGHPGKAGHSNHIHCQWNC